MKTVYVRDITEKHRETQRNTEKHRETQRWFDVPGFGVAAV